MKRVCNLFHKIQPFKNKYNTFSCDENFKKFYLNRGEKYL